MSPITTIAVGIDRAGWHKRFAAALDDKIAKGYRCQYQLVNVNAHDWQQQIAPFDIILWKPHYMGVKSASYLKEKIYCLQHIAGKLVVPNYQTVWHFESKIAQSYLLAHYGIKSPDTAVSFDYDDACQLLGKSEPPYVFKLSEGAGSANVCLESSKKRAQARLKPIFNTQFWENARQQYSSVIRLLLANAWKRWLWARLLHRLHGATDNANVVYWQEFIPDNTADLRITVIGDRYAFGFWRNNRPGDFRASGSGLIDYQRAIPEEPLRYCLDLSRKLGFDSMCYDILFRKNDFVVTEISYGYLDTAIHNTAGHYVLEEDGSLSYKLGHVWPQELWVEWTLHRAESQRSNKG